jgi:hypothetical protein
VACRRALVKAPAVLSYGPSAGAAVRREAAKSQIFKGIDMRTLFTSAIAIAALIIAGCDSAKSPETVAKHVDAAEQKAAAEVTKSEQAAEKDLTKAAEKVDDKVVDFNNAAAKDAYNLAVAKADGDRKVALANCQALGGDAQKTCKDQADADYSAAKANAKASALSLKQ